MHSASTRKAVESFFAPVPVTLDTKLTGVETGETAEALIVRSRGMDLKAAA